MGKVSGFFLIIQAVVSGARRESRAKLVSTVTSLPVLAIPYNFLPSREYIFFTGMMLCLKTSPCPNLGYFLHTQALATMQLSAQGTENPTSQLPTDNTLALVSIHSHGNKQGNYRKCKAIKEIHRQKTISQRNGLLLTDQIGEYF